MDFLIDTLGPYLLYIGIAAVVLALLVLLGLVLMVRRAARRARAAELEALAAAGAEGPPEESPEVTASVSESEAASGASVKSLRRSFRTAMRVLRRHVSGRGYRYQIPWFAMIGEAGAGKTAALHGVALNLPLGRPLEPEKGSRRGCNWWFFDRGIVLDISGDYILQREQNTSEEKEWRSFLRLLQRFRPQRPVDGVVLAIPATDLLGPDALSRDDLTVKADIINRKLWQMQKTLGVCFPVYVLVTKCDAVPGFRSFWRELPAERQDEMFGWSSPYALAAAYSPAWIDEAFETMAGGLFQAQMEIGAAGQDPADGDGMFLFPGRFRSIRAPLGVYLDQIFRPTVYHESFFFRGLYFSGDVGADVSTAPEHRKPGDLFAAPEAALGLGSGFVRSGARPTLVTHLFEDKVFPEHGLARPASRTLLSRNRAVLAAQSALAASVLIFGLGLWFAYDGLTADIRSLQPVLEGIGDDVARLRDQERRAAEVAGDGDGAAKLTFLQESSARRLLDVMAHVRTKSLTSVFIPSSWFSDLDDHIGRFIAGGFENIIMRAMYNELVVRTRTLLAAPVEAGADEAAALEGLDDMAEFQALVRLLDEIENLEANVARYNGLGDTQDLRDVAELSRFLFDIELPPGIFEYPEFFRRALHSVAQRRFEIERFGGRATARVRDTTWRLYGRLFYSGAISRQLYGLTQKLRALEEPARSLELEAVALRESLDAIERTEKLLGSPDVAWIAGDVFNPGVAFGKAMARVADSAFLGPELSTELVAQGQSEFERFKQKLGAYKAGLTGPLLAREEGRVRMRAAEPLVGLRLALSRLFAQDFMTVKLPQPIDPTYSPVKRLVWSPRRLDAAVVFFEEFDAFMAEHLDVFPFPLQARVRDLALARLETNMATEIAGSQSQRVALSTWHVQAEEDLAREIRDFRKASGVLTQLLTVLEQLQMPESYQALHAVSLAHAADLLERVDRLLNGEHLYLPAESLELWDGREPPVFFAFQAHDDTEVLHYLDLQRDRVDVLLRDYAEPLIAFLAGSHFRRDRSVAFVVGKWRRIFEELNKYANRQTGSSVVKLEKFIRFDMFETTAANCHETLSAGDRKPSGDFFLARRNALHAALLDRCRDLAGERVEVRYARIADLFNDTLADRYPFADVGPGETIRDADPQDIRTFYLTFDREADAVEKLLEDNPVLGAPGRAAIGFLRDMAKVRDFLAPVLAADLAGIEPLYNTKVDFRVNRAADVGSNQIIEWALDLGSKRFLISDVKLDGTWRFGDPVRVSLRWAKDSPATPVTGPDAGMRIENERTVVWEYDNAWSMLRLLERHRGQAGDFARGVDTTPHTLRFAVPTSTVKWVDPDAVQRNEEVSETKVFIWLGLTTTPKEGERVKHLQMPTFPRRAPSLMTAEK